MAEEKKRMEAQLNQLEEELEEERTQTEIMAEKVKRANLQVRLLVWTRCVRARKTENQLEKRICKFRNTSKFQYLFNFHVKLSFDSSDLAADIYLLRESTPFHVPLVSL